MKLSEALMESMNQIDENYLAQSETYTEKKRVFSLKPVLTFAAAAVLIFAVMISADYNPIARLSRGIYDSAAPKEASVFAPEKNDSDGFAPMSEIVIDKELQAYLEGLDDSAVVTVMIEMDTSYNMAMQDESAAVTDDMEAEPEVKEMTKAEILGFEGEEGVRYIFHLYSADEKK